MWDQSICVPVIDSGILLSVTSLARLCAGDWQTSTPRETHPLYIDWISAIVTSQPRFYVGDWQEHLACQSTCLWRQASDVDSAGTCFIDRRWKFEKLRAALNLESVKFYKKMKMLKPRFLLHVNQSSLVKINNVTKWRHKCKHLARQSTEPLPEACGHLAKCQSPLRSVPVTSLTPPKSREAHLQWLTADMQQIPLIFDLSGLKFIKSN